MTIRQANENDTEGILRLLRQVLEVHASLRPDLFISGTTKYNADDLKDIYSHCDKMPVFVALDDNDEVLGYVFCSIREYEAANNTRAYKNMYIDDLCVDENQRGKHIASALYNHAKEYAGKTGCYNITLNVWEGNSARAFYDKLGLKVRVTTMEEVL